MIVLNSFGKKILKLKLDTNMILLLLRQTKQALCLWLVIYLY